MTLLLPRGFQQVQEAAGGVGTGARPGYSIEHIWGRPVLCPAWLCALQLLCCMLVLSHSGLTASSPSAPSLSPG